MPHGDCLWRKAPQFSSLGAMRFLSIHKRKRVISTPPKAMWAWGWISGWENQWMKLRSLYWDWIGNLDFIKAVHVNHFFFKSVQHDIWCLGEKPALCEGGLGFFTDTAEHLPKLWFQWATELSKVSFGSIQLWEMDLEEVVILVKQELLYILMCLLKVKYILKVRKSGKSNIVPLLVLKIKCWL